MGEYHPVNILTTNNPAEVKKHLEEAEDTFKKTGEWIEEFKKRHQQVVDLCDEYKRPGTLFDIGVELAQKVGSVLGDTSVFWKYHEKHLEILKDAIDASTALDKGRNAFDLIMSGSGRINDDVSVMMKQYGSTSDRFNGMKVDFGILLIVSSLLKSTIEYDVNSKTIRPETVKSWFKISEEVKSKYNNTVDDIKLLEQAYAGLRQTRSGFDKLLEIRRISADRLVSTNNNFGKIFTYAQEQYEGLELVSRNATSLSQIINDVDRSIDGINSLIAVWISSVDSFVVNLQKLDVFAARRLL